MPISSRHRTQRWIALRAQQHRTFLVHGVTGSGKTEVYIQAIQEVVRYGRQAIVLVPEISSTAADGRSCFRRRFGRGGRAAQPSD